MNEKTRYGLIIFLSILLINFLQVFQGIDLTDDGLFLINSYRSFPTPEIKDPVFGASTLFMTNYIGGAWLHLSSQPSVMHARIGSIIIISLIALLSFLTIAMFFKPKHAFYPVIASSIFLSAFNPKNINYHAVPAILTVLAIYFFAKGVISYSKGQEKKGNLWLIMSGILLVADALSLFNIIVLAIGIPALLFIGWIITRDKSMLKASGFLSIGCVAGLTLFAALFWQIGYLDSYLTQIYNTLFKGFFANNKDYFYGHAASFTILTYIRDLIRSTIIFAIGMICAVILNKIEEKTKKPATNIVLALAGILVFFVMLKMPDFGRNSMLAASYTIAIIVTIILAPQLFNAWKNRKNWNDKKTATETEEKGSRAFFLTAILGIIFMWLIPTGSDDGMLRTVTGLWFIMPFAITSLETFNKRTPNWKILKTKIVAYFLEKKKTLLTFLIIATMIYLLFMFPSARDAPRYELNTPFTHPSLAGIYSSKERTAEIDPLLFLIEENTNPGDKILVVADAPLLYYLTQTKPLYGEGWVTLDTLQQIKKFEETADARNEKPKLLIFSKHYMSMPYWPKQLISMKGKRDSQEISDYLMQKYIELGYEKIFEDELMIVIRQP